MVSMPMFRSLFVPASGLRTCYPRFLSFPRHEESATDPVGFTTGLSPRVTQSTHDKEFHRLLPIVRRLFYPALGFLNRIAQHSFTENSAGGNQLDSVVMHSRISRPHLSAWKMTVSPSMIIHHPEQKRFYGNFGKRRKHPSILPQCHPDRGSRDTMKNDESTRAKEITDRMGVSKQQDGQLLRCNSRQSADGIQFHPATNNHLDVDDDSLVEVLQDICSLISDDQHNHSHQHATSMHRVAIPHGKSCDDPLHGEDINRSPRPNAVAAALTMGTMSANHTIHSSDTEVQSREQHVSQYYSPQQQQLTHTANDKPTPKSSDKKSQQVHRQVEKRTTEDSNRAHTQNDMLLFFPEIMKILMDRIEKAQARADASLGRLRQERRALEQARDDLKRILSRAVVASCSCTNARTCLSKRYKETQQQTIISPVGNESDDCTHRIRGATESKEK